jgi:hypothetical protein
MTDDENITPGLAARRRLGEATVQSIHMAALIQAVAALYDTHPRKKQAHARFDELVTTLQTKRGFAQSLDAQTVLREFVTEMLFE